ncbi:MAG: recombinase family protein [Dehalococcoidia bacterium]|jgi:DNA invertase Pin-like site-specific DNA recombinase
MKAIGYFRIASDIEQDVTYTMKEQEKLFSQFCSENGHEPVNVFSDLDSGLHVSGTQYRSMLSYILKNKGDFIIVIKSLRHLHPGPQELIQCLIELDALSVKVHFIDSLRGEPLSIALSNWAEQYHGDKNGERVKEAMKVRAVRGMGLGKPPFGYRIGSDHKYELVPEEAETISLIYRLYLQEGKGVRLIARYLNEQKITTRSGGRWSIVGVRDVLRNRSYVGTSERFGLRVPGSHPAIVPFQVFNQVQERLTARASHRGHVVKTPFLLAGMVYCGRCNNKMTGMNRSQSWTSKKSGIKHSGEYRYYQCQSRTNQSFCQYNTRKVDELEAVVKADLQKLSRPENREKLISNPQHGSDPQMSDQPHLKKMIRSLDRKFRTYLDKAAKGEITVDELRELGGDVVRERRLMEERLNRIWAEARGEITSEQRRGYTFRDLDDLLARWDSLSFSAKRLLMRNVIDRIIVRDDHVETVLWL